jgi:hypothetical protein
MKKTLNTIVATVMQPQFIKAACFCLFMVLIMANHVHAQGPGDPGAGNGGSNGEPDAPIDGGLSLLVAAGVGYGAKKMKDRKAKAK